MNIFQEFPFDQISIKDRDIVFDMDGTLIEGDFGETVYFHTLLAEFMEDRSTVDWLKPIWAGLDGHAALLTDEGARIIADYRAELASGNYAEAYLSTARRLDKYPRENIETLSQALLSGGSHPQEITCQRAVNGRVERFQISYGIRIKPEMIKLVDSFNRHGANLWIVSASPQMLCEFIAKKFKIDLEHVIGTSASENGSNHQRFPWGVNKLNILSESEVTHPLFVFGDSIGDLEMLDIAEYPVVVEGNSKKILQYAIEKDWWIYSDGAEHEMKQIG